MESINLPIIELSRVDMIMYSDGSGCYHLNASYLFQVDGNDELVGEFNGRKEHIALLPHVKSDTPVTIRSENGNVLGTTTFGEIE